MSNETEPVAAATPETTTQEEAPQETKPAPTKANPSYKDEFPTLGAGSQKPWANTAGAKLIKSSEVSTTFTIPHEEQQKPTLGKGTAAEQGKLVCLRIAKETATSIEFAKGKDNGLVVIVTGKQANVAEAKKKVMAQMTQQGSISVFIPKDHHRFVLGKGAERLKEIEKATGAKIRVPKSDEPAETPITITGAKEAMAACKAKIEKISQDQYAKHRETIECPAWLRPFIRGGNDSNLDKLKAKYGIAAVDIPPPKEPKPEITVRGQQKGAVAAAAELRELIKRKEAKCKSVNITIDKKQHKFVIGPKGRNIQDVMEKCNVSVEVPGQDDNSNVITLRGEQQDMGAAITAVYGFASSHQDAFIACPEWMHRLLIGQKGATIKDISEKFGFEKVQIDFSKEAGKCGISLEGTPSELEAVQNELERRIAEITASTAHVELDIPAAYHPHLIGKGGANLKKLDKEHKVTIKIPQESSGQKVWIEGPPAGVKAAAAELKQLADRLADETEDTIQLNRRFHRQLIGAGGANIRALREKFPNVNINVPDENSKSDTITLRGPSKELKNAKIELAGKARDIEEKGYRIDVPILKAYHRNIIGKNGINISRIRDETNCQIELPKQDSDSEIITIIGRKADAEKARKELRKIEKEHVEIEETTVKIETKLHQALIGAGGKGVKKLQGENAIIHFPSDGSDQVTIRGKKDAVAAAKKALLDEAGQLRLQSFTATVQAASDFHRFLIGRGGSNMKSIRDKTGCRIAVPGPNDEKKDIITVMGTKEGVAEAKKILEAEVAKLKDLKEEEVSVPQKYHKNFTQRRAELINRIADDCGGVQISFPRAPKEEGEEVSDVVTVKGPASCVAAAVLMIKDNVENFESQITDSVDIDKIHHRVIIGQGGKQVQEIQANFNVQIKFPGREPTDEENNTIFISGRAEKVAEAKEAILALVPVTVEYELNASYHRDLIGEKGNGLKEITTEFPIRITVPKKEEGQEPSDIITLVGKAELVDGCVARLNELKIKWEAAAEDRERASYSETIEVHQMFHSKIIGQKGATINKLNELHNARVNFPSSRSKELELADDEIKITGYPECVEAMKAAIMEIVKGLESHVVQDVLINKSVHPRIIGNRGSNIRKLMNEFSVDIKIGRSPAQPDKVSVTGPSEKVEECIDHLLNMEEEILQELAEREDDMPERYRPKKTTWEEKKVPKNPKNQGYRVADAPWDEDFPTLSENGAAPGANSNWRPK